LIIYRQSLQEIHRFPSQSIVNAGIKTVTLTFYITPEEHLYYPEHTGEAVTESGYYTLIIGNLSASYYLNVPENHNHGPYFWHYSKSLLKQIRKPKIFCNIYPRGIAGPYLFHRSSGFFTKPNHAPFLQSAPS